jgi:tRNA-uridine 2-sulfurtransferase
MLRELREMTRALAVLSGDLDSILATKAVMEQGVDVTGICFKSAFFSYESAVKASEKLNLELKIIDITDEHFRIVKGYVNDNKDIKNICKDCSYMKLSYAIRTLKDIEADFLVLSEDFEVNQENLLRKSGYSDERSLDALILRPLNIRHMTPTIMEERGILDREKLLRFYESRDKARVELAEEIGLKGYIAYEDKCRLSNPLFSSRLKELFAYNKDCTVKDIERLM